MSTLVEMQTLRSGLERSLMKPPEEAEWQAWVAKGYAQEKRRSAEGMRFARRVSIVGLLIVAGLWSHGTPYEIAVRVVVTAGALVVMLGAFNARKYALAAVSATLMLLCNPFPRTFSFSTDWQRTLVAASTVPFVISLSWSTSRMERNDAI